MALKLGVPAKSISFDNVAVSKTTARVLYSMGITRFTVDSAERLRTLTEISHPRRPIDVVIRLRENPTSEPKPGTNIGCSFEDATSMARNLKNNPNVRLAGFAFQPSAKTAKTNEWTEELKTIAPLFSEFGHDLQLVLSLGVPTQYRDPKPSVETFLAGLDKGVTQVFANERPRCAIQPGSALVAKAGLMVTKVETIKPEHPRAVSLNVGVFNGAYLAGSTKFPDVITASHKRGQLVETDLRGPSSVTSDQFAGKNVVPSDLQVGDVVVIPMAGAYMDTFLANRFMDTPRSGNRIMRDRGLGDTFLSTSRVEKSKDPELEGAMRSARKFASDPKAFNHVDRLISADTGISLAMSSGETAA